MARVLLLFSGGFDSTAALIYLLTKTKYKVDALHLCPATNLGKIEAECCRNIRQYCKKYRPFRYFKKNLDRIPYVVSMNVTRREAALWCNKQFRNKSVYKYVVFGRIKLDVRRNFYQRSSDAESKWRDAVLPQIARKTEFYFPIKDWSKKKVVDFIPDDLIPFVWSCQKPMRDAATKRPKGCKKCSSCKDMRRLLKEYRDLKEKFPSMKRVYF